MNNVVFNEIQVEKKEKKKLGRFLITGKLNYAFVKASIFFSAVKWKKSVFW